VTPETSRPRQRQYYVVFMTTQFTSLDEARRVAPTEMAMHLANSRKLHDAGVLLMAGAFLDRPDEPVRTMGVLVSRAAAEDYARSDPFVQAGLVSEWTVREWANMLA
jgi:uncharacterized protein YciI